MQVDQATLDRFVGGEIEIQNPNERYIYRGEVSGVVLNGDELHFDLAWMAKGQGNSSLPTGWERYHQLTYDVSLMIYTVSDIGGDRLCLNSFITCETTVLFPPNGSKLDQSLIKEKDVSSTV